jgi:F0F1-type ATP synthase assembly protein I
VGNREVAAANRMWMEWRARKLTDPTRPRSAWAEAARLSDLGLRLVVLVGAGCYGGIWLDRKVGAGGFPWFALAGSIVGFAAGLFALVRGLTREDRE